MHAIFFEFWLPFGSGDKHSKVHSKKMQYFLSFGYLLVQVIHGRAKRESSKKIHGFFWNRRRKPLDSQPRPNYLQRVIPLCACLI
jgi:hypothetical protein